MECRLPVSFRDELFQSQTRFMLPVPHTLSRDSFQPFEVGVPVVFVTSQSEMPGDSLWCDKLLEKRRRKLDGPSSSASNHNVPDRPSIIVQVLFRRDGEVKFVSAHRNRVLLAAKAELGGKASRLDARKKPRFQLSMAFFAEDKTDFMKVRMKANGLHRL